MFAFGQFLDHDLGLTDEAERKYVDLCITSNEELRSCSPIHWEFLLKNEGICSLKE